MQNIHWQKRRIMKEGSAYYFGLKWRGADICDISIATIEYAKDCPYLLNVIIIAW